MNDVLEDGVAVGEEIREVVIPDGVDVDKGRVEGEGGVSRLEGTGMGEVNDGTGELKEPDMLSILMPKEGQATTREGRPRRT